MAAALFLAVASAAALAGCVPVVCAGAAPALHAPANDTAPAATPMAFSADGRLMLVMQADPPCLVVWHAEHDVPVHTITPATRDGRIAARVAALRTAVLRRSFIVAPADLPELWEISYDPKAEEIYDGLVHDYRLGEGVPRRGYLGLRRTALPEPLADFVLDEDEAEAWGLAPPPPAGSGEGQVINLDVRRRVAVEPAARMQAAMQALRDSRDLRARGAQAQAAVQMRAPSPLADLAQKRSASRPWPCAAPKVPGP